MNKPKPIIILKPLKHYHECMRKMKKIILDLVLFVNFLEVYPKWLDGIQIVKTLTKDEQGQHFEWTHMWSEMPPTFGLTSISNCILQRFKTSG